MAAFGSEKKPVVLITGATGNLGTSIAAALADAYEVVGLDRDVGDTGFPVLQADLTSAESIGAALGTFRGRWGGRIASVIHLAAYFDFTGEEHPLYQKLNVEGTRLLLRALQRFEVEQFVYASTMLVHAPAEAGETIDEEQPIGPRWAYPKSKAAAEQAIREEAGEIPYVLLRLAGVYDKETMVPTLAHQIARIYERDFQSHLYSGDTGAGQAMLHRDDMVDAFRRAVERRGRLPGDAAILVGEPEALSYDRLQDEIGRLLHGREEWTTLRVPKPLAAAGAWAQDKLEPLIPDAIDKGDEPFIKPFMVRMADDHYDLDISRARDLLGWVPARRLAGELPGMIARLKRDPLAWYNANGLTPPAELEQAQEIGFDPAELRARHEAYLQRQHRAWRWAHFVNIALGTWIVTQPPLIGVQSPWLTWIEIALGAGLILFSTLSLSWRMQWARWMCAGIGILLMAVPFVFWTESAADYLSDTLVGMLVFGLAFASKPDPAVSPIAAVSGPSCPLGWSYNPSTWTQRIPIIALAFIGLYVSRYLAGYQLGHIDDVWDPFFAGSAADSQNGTEEIITSHVSEAFPVSDAALGGYVYALEIVTGAIGTTARWRTMPWLVILFGILIAPLGIVSILFIIIQPIVLDTWSIIALTGAAAMLIQIPYSLDELLASVQFVRRRAKAGRNWVSVLFGGDTDEGKREGEGGPGEFDQAPGKVVREMVLGGVNLPWNLAVAVAIGLWLLFTRVTLGAQGTMADMDHLIGSLVLTVVSVAAAEVARPARWLLVPLGMALAAMPFLHGADTVQTVAGVVLGLALVLLAVRRGPIRQSYGSWNKVIGASADAA